MEKSLFIPGEIYHIFNRGVEKRDIFLEDKDRFRFIHDMFEFNDIAPALNIGYHFQADKFLQSKARKILVEILCFCLMPNHYHFMIRQKTKGGITEFMRKLGTGYTNYFNKKYQRVGPLFQGKFKAKHLTKQSHFLYLPHYIHLNPLDLFMPEWREGKITNTKKVLQFLESYRWSSYLDYINKKNFPSVIKIYRSSTSIDYKNEVKEWLESFDLKLIQNFVLEN